MPSAKIQYYSKESINLIQMKRDDAYIVTMAKKVYYFAYYAKLRAVKQAIRGANQKNIKSLNKIYKDLLFDFRQAEGSYVMAGKALKNYNQTLYVLKRHEKLLMQSVREK